jgi:hypothetical protein
VRRLLQREQRGGLLHDGGRAAEVVGRQLGKAELALGGEFPGQRRVDVGGQGLGLDQQLAGRGLLEAQQLVGGLDLDALARVELDLGGGFGLGKDAAGQELAGFVEKHVHGGDGLSHQPRRPGPAAQVRFMNEIGCLPGCSKRKQLSNQDF